MLDNVRNKYISSGICKMLLLKLYKYFSRSTVCVRCLLRRGGGGGDVSAQAQRRATPSLRATANRRAAPVRRLNSYFTPACRVPRFNFTIFFTKTKH